MMSRKTISRWVIIAIIAFVALVILYPVIFQTEKNLAPSSDGGSPGLPPIMPAPPPPTIPPIK